MNAKTSRIIVILAAFLSGLVLFFGVVLFVAGRGGFQVGQAVVAVIAVLAVSGEYSSGMIQVTLTAMPRRLTVLAAKAALTTGLVLAAGAVAVLAAFVLAPPRWPGRKRREREAS